MMAEKKVTHVVKLQIQAGKANPAPPVGPALGPTGINIMQFCKDFNEKTAKDAGMIFPVILTVYADKTKKAQVEEIANIKMRDLNASSLDSAVSIIKGTARSMGIVVED